MLELCGVLDEIGIGRYQWVQTLVTGGLWMVDGAEILLCSSVLKALQTIWNLGPLLKASMMSIIFLGVFVGNLLGGSLADNCGRRKVLLWAYACMVLLGFLTAGAWGPASMLLARFFFGVSYGMGIGPGVALKMESAPSDWRGHLLNLDAIFFAAGELYTAVLLLIFMPSLQDPDGSRWREVTLLAVLPGMVMLPFAALLLRESPHFLLSKDRRTEASEVLWHIARVNGRTETLRALLRGQRAASSAPPADERPSTSALEKGHYYKGSTGSGKGISISGGHSSGNRATAGAAGAAPLAAASELASESERGAAAAEAEVELPLAQLGGGSGVGTAARGSEALPLLGPVEGTRQQLRLVLGRDFRSIVGAGAYLCFLVNLLFYGLSYGLPQTFSSMGRGVTPALQVLVVALCSFPGVLLSILLIQSKAIGHRDSLALLAGLSTVLQLALITIDRGSDWRWLGLPSAYLAKYVATAFFTITYVYLGEVFPSAVRCTGLSICIAFGRLGSILAPVLFEVLAMLRNPVGPHAAFLTVNSLLCLVAIFVIRVCLSYELKNAPLEHLSLPSAVESAGAARSLQAAGQSKLLLQGEGKARPERQTLEVARAG